MHDSTCRGCMVKILKCLEVTLTLWILRWGPLDPSWYVVVVYSYLLNFCRQWYLCKFLILGGLSNHQFGLAFPCPTSEKMRAGVHWIGGFLVVLRWDFLNLRFLKDSLKKLFWHFLYMFEFTHPQVPFRQLGPSFLG